MSLVLRNATLADGSVVDVTVADGLIVSIQPSDQRAGEFRDQRARVAHSPDGASGAQVSDDHVSGVLVAGAAATGDRASGTPITVGPAAGAQVSGAQVSGAQGSIPHAAQSVGLHHVDEVRDLSGYLLVAAAAEPHAHLDKAFLADRVPNPRGDLMTAIEGMQRWHHTMTHADIVERAERAVRIMVGNGITSIRSHADTMTGHGLASVRALAEVRERVAGLCDLEIVVLMGSPLSGIAGAEHRALLNDALAAGGDVVGGCPHLEEDSAGAVEVALSIAAAHGVPIDLHTDETLNPRMLSLRTLAERVLATGFPHPAAASHCVSLGMVDEATQRSVAELVAAAGISVIALPQTNLFLQARGVATAVPRGLTAVRALMDAGVNVAAGADNVQDPFNTVGRADPMETAALMVMAGHLSPDEAMASVTIGARRAMAAGGGSIAVGQPAELVALRSGSVREAVAFGPVERVVLHHGRIVSDRRLIER